MVGWRRGWRRGRTDRVRSLTVRSPVYFRTGGRCVVRVFGLRCHVGPGRRLRIDQGRGGGRRHGCWWPMVADRGRRVRTRRPIARGGVIRARWCRSNRFVFRPGSRLRMRPGRGPVGDERSQHGDDFPECEGEGLMGGVMDGVGVRGGNRRFGWRGVRHPGCGAGGDGSRPRRPVEIRAGCNRCFY